MNFINLPETEMLKIALKNSCTHDKKPAVNRFLAGFSHLELLCGGPYSGLKELLCLRALNNDDTYCCCYEAEAEINRVL